MIATARLRFSRMFDNAPERLLRSPVGALATLPWLDPAVLFAMRRWYFPLSRLWASANAAGQDLPLFMREAGIANLTGNKRILAQAILRRHDRLRRTAQVAEQAWRDALFDGSASPAEPPLEQHRRAAAHRWMSTRTSFYPLLYGARIAPVRWRIPALAEVEAVYGPALDNPALAYPCPDPMPSVQLSRPVLGAKARTRWMRFVSPSQRVADICYARLVEPDIEQPLGTVIVGNGVCVESDMLDGMIDAATSLVGLGMRVIEITAPWHGWRCPRGEYGGERFFASAPIGQIDLFSAQAQESAVLIDWAHRRFGGPVALAGISLGSFVAQLVASHGKHWPAGARPDALMLVTHSGRMEEVVFESGLVDSIGIPQALARAAWRERDMLRWAPLMNPQGDPSMPAERIVSVLGSADRVTPVRGGLDLVRRWGVPEENRFVQRQGHFGSALKLLRDDRPLKRLVAVMTG